MFSIGDGDGEIFRETKTVFDQSYMLANRKLMAGSISDKADNLIDLLI